MTSEPGTAGAGQSPTGHDGSGGTSLVFRSWLLRLCLMLAAVLISASLAELGLRLFFASRLELVQDERNLLYRYDPVLGWFPIPNGSNHFRASREITILHNRQGFRGADYSLGAKPRIIFLGDSFVWGYDVEAPERFTDRLQARHPEWSVYNFGVSGYGTDQEYILLQKAFDSYKPNVVFLLFSTETDDLDNTHNCFYGYYKPYCTVNGTHLELHGIPVPKSQRVFFAEHTRLAHYYLVRLLVLAYYKVAAPAVIKIKPTPTGALIRDMQKYVQGKGAAFVVGETQHNPPLEEFLRYFKVPFVDLSNPMRYPEFGQHWTPEGHAFVATKVEEFLLEGKFLDINK